MTQQQFNDWLTTNYDYFLIKFSKQYGKPKETIREDLSDFYVNVIEKNKLNKIENFENYLASFIYYRHFQFFAETRAERQGFMVNNKKISIKLDNQIKVDIADETEIDEYEWENKYKDFEAKIANLSLDDKILFNLRFINEMKIAEIGREFGLQKPWISKKIKRLKNRLNDNNNNILPSDGPDV